MRQSLVALACDKNYAPYSICLASRIAELHSTRDFDICIFSLDKLELPQQCSRLGITARCIADHEPALPQHPAGRHGPAAYTRLLIPSIIRDVYQRVLYLDTDIVCEKEGLNQLLQVDLGDHCVGAVRDNKQWRTPNKRVPEFAAIGARRHPYCNTGVLLIDIDRWIQQDMSPRILMAIQDFPNAIFHSDQSALNIVTQGQWAEMSPIWNWQYTYASRFFAELVEPRLIHFIGPNKPWSKGNSQFNIRFRRFFADVDAESGNRATTPGASHEDDQACWPSDLRKSLWKHYTSCRAMKRYLDRFASPYQLLDARSGKQLGGNNEGSVAC